MSATQRSTVVTDPAPVVAPVIPVGFSTKLGVIFTIIASLKPIINEIEGLVNDTAAHWGTADKVSLIAAAAVTGITILSRGAQAIAAILRGNLVP